MRISAPPFLFPCYYGTDVDSPENLIACHHTAEEIAKLMDADTLGFLGIDSVKLLTGCENANAFCTACFTGNYPTAIPTNTAPSKYERKISEGKAKKAK